jgi:hypothetical protein
LGQIRFFNKVIIINFPFFIRETRWKRTLTMAWIDWTIKNVPNKGFHIMCYKSYHIYNIRSYHIMSHKITKSMCYDKKEKGKEKSINAPKGQSRVRLSFLKAFPTLMNEIGTIYPLSLISTCATVWHYTVRFN